MLTEILMSLFAIDSFRLWRRATNYPNINHLSQTLEAPALLDDYRVISAPGVDVPESVLWGAVQWADDEGVLVADLIPAGLPTERVLGLLHQSHPTDFSQHPFAPGITGGVACLVHTSILELYAPPANENGDEVSSQVKWIDYAQSLKRYAPWESALLLVEGWRLTHAERRQVVGETPIIRREVAKALFKGSFEQARLATPIVLGLLAWLVWSDPMWGTLTLFIWMIQPLIIFSSTGFNTGALRYSLLRPLVELWGWVESLGSTSTEITDEERARLTESYQAQISAGIERFFREPVESCPLCQDSQLTTHLTVPDYYQQKPGTFNLDRCMSCDHIFQNPQLTIEGLDFYYRDFYDGLGERGMDLVFGATETSYRQRVAMIRAHGSPRQWLDVGGGHGHFALIAKHLLPQTRFDVLDLSESVEFAEQRQWCDRGIRGLFTEMATELSGTYDGISMSHYLEHTPDPLAELDACAEVLDEGGMLMIEIPDPQSKIGRTLGRLWLPWFQPQHLHFMSTGNLSGALEQRGFEVHEVDRHEAHQSVDFFFTAIILLQRIAPDFSMPWRPQRSAMEKGLLALWRALMTLLFIPLIILAVILDKACRPLLTRPGLSNTLRLIAIKGVDSESDQEA